MADQQKSTSNKPTAHQSKRSEQIATVVKIVIVGVALVALGMFAMWGMEEMKVRGEYNRIVEIINEQRYQEAITALKDLRSDVDPELQARIDSDLAQCYVGLSQNLELSIKEQADLLNQAYALDPSKLSPDDRRIIGK